MATSLTVPVARRQRWRHRDPERVGGAATAVADGAVAAAVLAAAPVAALLSSVIVVKVLIDVNRVIDCYVESVATLPGDRAPRRLSFVDTFVKCSAGLWADTVSALLPSSISGTSYIDANKSCRSSRCSVTLHWKLKH